MGPLIARGRHHFAQTLLVLLCGVASGQYIGSEEIDGSKVKPWVATSPDAYQHVYHFGDSELESDLVLLVTPQGCVAQIRSGAFNDDATVFIRRYQTLTNVRIEGSRFFSDQTAGEFVSYRDGAQAVDGLKVNTPWSGIPEQGAYEIGYISGGVATYFAGKFTQASTRLLTRAELLAMPKADLGLMRNEVFARYGFRFKSGGTMDTHFRAQKWYQPQYDNVDGFVTELEKANIKTIRSVELERTETGK